MTEASQLTPLEWRILNVCCGGVERLRWDSKQREAEHNLQDAGLVRRIYVDDQPTVIATEKGKALREAMIAMDLEKKTSLYFTSGCPDCGYHHPPGGMCI
jgi:hypothetical protein